MPCLSSRPESSCSTSSSVKRSPSVVSKCLSSAEFIMPLPSLSKTRRPSMKSSSVDWSFFLLRSSKMGKNCSNEIRCSSPWDTSLCRTRWDWGPTLSLLRPNASCGFCRRHDRQIAWKRLWNRWAGPRCMLAFFALFCYFVDFLSFLFKFLSIKKLFCFNKFFFLNQV